MEKKLLELVQDFNLWHKPQEIGFERQELSQVLPLVEDTRIALIITGLRRAGKTFLARQILHAKQNTITPEQTLFINFEDPLLEPYLNIESLQNLYESYRYFLNKDKRAYIVLDEVQNVPKWEKWVRIQLEKNENIKFIITGSSSKIFKGELANVLSGRTVTFPLFPLNFSNFLQFKSPQNKWKSYSSLKPLLAEYIEYGGLPLVVTTSQKEIFLKQLFEDIIVKDIILKYKLREVEIKKIAILLLHYFSNLVSVQRLRNTAKEIAKVDISPTSINNYLYYFEDAFLFFFIPIFSYKIKEQMQYPRKAYCLDTGIINSLTLKFSENQGKLYENIVATTLFRRVGKENLFYWKSPAGYEVDFVIKEGLNVRQLIQVCYTISKDAKEREIRAVQKAAAEFGLTQALIITEQDERKEHLDSLTITYIPLWKWLLQEMK